MRKLPEKLGFHLTTEEKNELKDSLAQAGISIQDGVRVLLAISGLITIKEKSKRLLRVQTLLYEAIQYKEDHEKNERNDSDWHEPTPSEIFTTDIR